MVVLHCPLNLDQILHPHREPCPVCHHVTVSALTTFLIDGDEDGIAPVKLGNFWKVMRLRTAAPSASSMST